MASTVLEQCCYRRSVGIDYKCITIKNLGKHILFQCSITSSTSHPFITERLLMGRKESNQTNKQNIEYQTKRMINVTISLTFLSRMKLPSFIKWTSPFSSSVLLCIVFHSYSNVNRTTCKQTVENLIRLCSLWRLILACTICLCPTRRTLV